MLLHPTPPPLPPAFVIPCLTPDAAHETRNTVTHGEGCTHLERSEGKRAAVEGKGSGGGILASLLSTVVSLPLRFTHRGRDRPREKRTDSSGRKSSDRSNGITSSNSSSTIRMILKTEHRDLQKYEPQQAVLQGMFITYCPTIVYMGGPLANGQAIQRHMLAANTSHISQTRSLGCV